MFEIGRRPDDVEQNPFAQLMIYKIKSRTYYQRKTDICTLPKLTCYYQQVSQRPYLLFFDQQVSLLF